MPREQLQLQITLSIGSQKYQIKVPKRSDLQTLVRKFLKENNLNQKHEQAIIRLVKAKLNQNEEKNIAITKQLKTKLPKKLKDNNQSSSLIKEPKQSIKQTAKNSKNTPIANSKMQQEIDPSKKQIPSDSRKLYEKWKQKEKDKKAKQIHQREQHKEQQSFKLSTYRQKHSSDYFYNKGIKFEQQCEENCLNNFKKIYPFKISERTLTQGEQQQLYSRLYSGRYGQHQKRCRKYKISSQQYSQSSIKQDPIKLYIKRQDDKIDRQVFKILKQGYSISLKKQSSKSPFRKTILN